MAHIVALNLRFVRCKLPIVIAHIVALNLRFVGCRLPIEQWPAPIHMKADSNVEDVIRHARPDYVPQKIWTTGSHNFREVCGRVFASSVLCFSVRQGLHAPLLAAV
jgi:hypothetical protein